MEKIDQKLNNIFLSVLFFSLLFFLVELFRFVYDRHMPNGTEVQTANVLSIVFLWIFTFFLDFLSRFSHENFLSGRIFHDLPEFTQFSPTHARKKSSLSFSTVKTPSSRAFSDVSWCKIMDFFSPSLFLHWANFCTHFPLHRWKRGMDNVFSAW